MESCEAISQIVRHTGARTSHRNGLFEVSRDRGELYVATLLYVSGGGKGRGWVLVLWLPGAAYFHGGSHSRGMNQATRALCGLPLLFSFPHGASMILSHTIGVKKKHEWR